MLKETLTLYCNTIGHSKITSITVVVYSITINNYTHSEKCCIIDYK